MIEDWIFIAILAGLSSQVFNFLSRFTLKDGDDSSSFGWLTEVFRLLVYLTILPINFWIDFSINSLFQLLALGFVNFASVYFFFKMHSLTELSISSIIARTRLIWIPLIAFIFLGEELAIIQYIGIAILFFGLSITVAPNKIFADRGILYSFITSIIVAIISVLMKALTPLASVSFIMIFMALPTVLLYPFLLKNGFTRAKSAFKQKMLIKIAASAGNLAAMYLTVLALKDGPVSIVSGIYQAMMIVAVLAGIIFLNERKNALRKILGASIAVGGIILLTI